MTTIANGKNRKCAEAISKRELAVCILFYERLEQTVKCIRSILPSGVKIYILNNGSSQLSRQELGRICSGYKQVKIFDSSINLGVGIGRNHLLGHTTEEWMVFLDNDIIVKTRSWVDRITCHIESFKDNEVFIPRLFNAHEHRYVPYQPIQVTCSGRIRGMQVVDDMINWFPGGASFVSRRLFERLGAYDERMFVGLEDLELGVRAIRSENPVRGRLIDDIELVHKHIGSKTDIDRQAVLTRYNLALIEASTKRLNEKHNVTYDDGWRSWAMEQLAYSMGRRRIVFELRWIFRSLSTKLRNRYWIRKLLERARAEVRI